MKRIAIPIILLAVAVALLTGCGGGGGGGNSSDISVQIQGPTGDIHAGDQIALTATVTGANDSSVAWSIAEGSPAGGTLSNIQANSVTYTAPNVDTGTFHVVARSTQDLTKSASFTVTVVSNPAGITVTVNGPTSPVAPQDSVQVTATVSGTSNQSVTWSIVEGSPAGGTLSNITPTSVTYTAPSVESTYHIQATSVQNTAKSGTAAIVVSLEPPPPPPGVSKK